MRKSPFSWLVLFALLFWQQGALVHEIEHQRGATQVAQQKAPDHSGDRVCSRCLAFAQLGGLLAPGLPALPLLSLSHQQPLVGLLQSTSWSATLSRNRDPPDLTI